MLSLLQTKHYLSEQQFFHKTKPQISLKLFHTEIKFKLKIRLIKLLKV